VSAANSVPGGPVRVPYTPRRRPRCLPAATAAGQRARGPRAASAAPPSGSGSRGWSASSGLPLKKSHGNFFGLVLISKLVRESNFCFKRTLFFKHGWSNKKLYDDFSGCSCKYGPIIAKRITNWISHTDQTIFRSSFARSYNIRTMNMD